MLYSPPIEANIATMWNGSWATNIPPFQMLGSSMFSGTFATFPTGLSGVGKFFGGAAVGDLAVLAPYGVREEGLFDAGTGEFSTVDVGIGIAPKNPLTSIWKWAFTA